jgi:type IV secretion system protein VirB11
VTSGPAFVIRKPPVAVYTLADQVVAGVLTPSQADVLSEAIDTHRNVVITGGTNTGKTTLANTLLDEIARRFPQERLVILEDTVELRCTATDHLALRTNEYVSLADLVRSALRSTPNRIVIGEVRGAEALDLLDAWATGHPGNVATVHASSAEGALRRLDRLAQRANVPPQAHLVAEAIDLVVVLAGTGSGRAQRRVTDLARVDGLTPDGRFTLLHLTEAATWLPT